MSLSHEERKFITELFNIKETNLDNIENQLQPQLYEFLSKNNNIRTIIDRVIFRTQNKFRPYDSVIITKFLTKEFDCVKSIMELVGNITGNFLIYIDFHFLFLCNPEQEEEEDELKFQFASKASAINDTYKIASNNDYLDLSNEFENKTYNDLLNAVFVHHVELYEYQNSGLRPYQLLSLVIHLQKFPG